MRVVNLVLIWIQTNSITTKILLYALLSGLQELSFFKFVPIVFSSKCLYQRFLETQHSFSLSVYKLHAVLLLPYNNLKKKIIKKASAFFFFFFFLLKTSCQYYHIHDVARPVCLHPTCLKMGSFCSKWHLRVASHNIWSFESQNWE